MNHLHAVLSKFPLSFARACADDVGVALFKLSLLKKVWMVFQVIKLLACLSLNAPKCVIVIVFEGPGGNGIDYVKWWLQQNLPQWSNFEVRYDGKYLGAYLGPSAGKHLWTAVLREWQ